MAYMCACTAQRCKFSVRVRESTCVPLWLKPTLVFACQVMCEDDPGRSNTLECVWMFFLKISSTDISTLWNITQSCTTAVFLSLSLTHTGVWVSLLTHSSVTPTLLPHSKNSRERINKYLAMFCFQACMRETVTRYMFIIHYTGTFALCF